MGRIGGPCSATYGCTTIKAGGTYPQGRRSACHAKALGTPIDKRLKEKKRDLARRMCSAMPKHHHMCWAPLHIRFLMSLRALQPKPSCGGWFSCEETRATRKLIYLPLL